MSNYFHTPVRDLHENNMIDSDDPEVDTGKTSRNRQTNEMPGTEEEKSKNSLRRTRQGIFTRSSPSILHFSNTLQLHSNSCTVKRPGLLDYKSILMKYKKSSVARPVSFLHDTKFPSYPLLVPIISSHHPLLLRPTPPLSRLTRTSIATVDLRSRMSPPQPSSQPSHLSLGIIRPYPPLPLTQMSKARHSHLPPSLITIDPTLHLIVLLSKFERGSIWRRRRGIQGFMRMR